MLTMVSDIFDHVLLQNIYLMLDLGYELYPFITKLLLDKGMDVAGNHQ